MQFCLLPSDTFWVLPVRSTGVILRRLLSPWQSTLEGGVMGRICYRLQSVFASFLLLCPFYSIVK